MKNVFIKVIFYYFRFFAQLALKLSNVEVIGITGSVGKSSARNTIYGMLKDNFPTKIVDKGNSGIGLPLGILGLHVNSLGFQTIWLSVFDYIRLFIAAPFCVFNLIGTKYLVVEMGIDSPYSPNNMEYLLSIVKPQISIFLNVYPTHTAEFDSMVPSTIIGDERRNAIVTNIAHEKAKIITESNSKVGIYNADNIFVKKSLNTAGPKVKLFSFGTEETNTVVLKNTITSMQGNVFNFIVQNTPVKITIKDYILPEEYNEIFAAAFIVGLIVGMNNETIVKSIENNFHLPAGRASLFKGIKNSTIIDSSYNASKAAVVAFLDLVATLKKQEERPVLFIFGDMRELGKESKMEHEEVANKINEVVDKVYCIGPQTKLYVLPITHSKVATRWFETAKDLTDSVKNSMPEDAIILVKGSQNTMYLEEVVKELLENPNDAAKLCRQSPYWLQQKHIN